MTEIETREVRAINYLLAKEEARKDKILFILTTILATPLLLSFAFILLSIILGWQL